MHVSFLVHYFWIATVKNKRHLLALSRDACRSQLGCMLARERCRQVEIHLVRSFRPSFALLPVDGRVALRERLINRWGIDCVRPGRRTGTPSSHLRSGDFPAELSSCDP